MYTFSYTIFIFKKYAVSNTLGNVKNDKFKKRFLHDRFGGLPVIMRKVFF